MRTALDCILMKNMQATTMTQPSATFSLTTPETRNTLIPVGILIMLRTQTEISEIYPKYSP